MITFDGFIFLITFIIIKLISNILGHKVDKFYEGLG